MQQPSQAQVAAQMVERVVAQGQQPVAFLMNAATSHSISEQFMAEVKKRMSLAARAWFWLTKRNTPPRLETLCGLPVLIYPMMQDGGMWLQAAGVTPNQAQQAAPAPPAEFMNLEPVAGPQPASDDVRPTLDDLSRGDGDRPSCSDVLMKAMENVDDLIGVVVVRVHKNRDVSLCLNCNQFETQGVLQKAQQWLMMRGY